MSGKKRVSSSEDEFSDSEGIIRVSAPENLASDAGEGGSGISRSRKKRKANTTPVTYTAPSPKISWSKNDELAILKGIADYQKKTGMGFSADAYAFAKFIKDDIESKFSKDQLLRKISRMKQKFQDNLVKKPKFTVAHDSKMFDLSMAIWGKDKVEWVADNQAKVTKVGAFVEPEGVKNDGLENDDESEKGEEESGDEIPSDNVDRNLEEEEEEFDIGEDIGEDDGKAKKDDGSAKGYYWEGELTPECVDKHVENETDEMKNEEDGAENELCGLQDAFEETLFKGLCKSAQTMMLQKMKSLSAEKRKELSDEWKALLVREIQLKIKKQSFFAKIAEAALQA